MSEYREWHTLQKLQISIETCISSVAGKHLSGKLMFKPSYWNILNKVFTSEVKNSFLQSIDKGASI